MDEKRHGLVKSWESQECSGSIRKGLGRVG